MGIEVNNNVISGLHVPFEALAKPEVDNSQVKTLRVKDSNLANYITQNLSDNVKASNSNIDMHPGVLSPQFNNLLVTFDNMLAEGLSVSKDTSSVNMTLPKSSQQSTLICMLIELANEAAIANIELSSTFGLMSENSSMSAAQAQKAQGLAIFAKSIVSSSINMAGNGVATYKSVKNYSATKVNINENMRGTHDADMQIRQMQNALNGSKNERLDLSDIAVSSTPVKKMDGSIAEFRKEESSLSAEHQAVANRNVDETIINRDAFQRAYLQGEARTRLTSSQIDAQRAIGMAGASVADGTGSLAHGVEQKEETEERSEAKVMDGAVEMSRQQAQKSQQMLDAMMRALTEVRTREADMVSSVANNLKA